MQLTRYLWGLLAMASVAHAGPANVSAKELLDSSNPPLSAADLREIFAPGSIAQYMSVDGQLGWVKTWSIGQDGKLLMANRNAPERWTYVSPGTWKVSDDGRYCVDIPWTPQAEKWCRPVYRLGDALYLGNPVNTRNPDQRIGRLTVLKTTPEAMLRDSDWTGHWGIVIKPWGPLPWEGELTLTAEGGTFRTYSRIFEKDNACLGRMFAVEIVQRMDIAMTFRVHASDVVAGCEDHLVTLVKIDANTLEGQQQSGGHTAVRLTRK